MTYLTDTDPDLALGPLRAAACTYRIALGPRAGQKVLSLQTVPTQEPPPIPRCCVSVDGVSWTGFGLYIFIICRDLTPLFGVRGRSTIVDLALGHESRVRRHLTRLTAALQRILSYLEQGDLQAIDRAVSDGFPVLRRISRNAAKHGIDHRVVFGFSLQTAPKLMDFLRRHRNELGHATGIRYSGELGHPFHVIDERTVVLPLDHPFVPEGRFASMLVEDTELAQNLATGFEGLWRKAMRDLREIDFHPGPRGTR